MGSGGYYPEAEVWRELLQNALLFARSVCIDRNDAEDLSQFALLKLDEKLRDTLHPWIVDVTDLKVSPVRAMNAWLRRVMLNELSSQRRSRHRVLGAGRNDIPESVQEFHRDRGDPATLAERTWYEAALWTVCTEVRHEVQPRFWEAFEGMAIEHRSAREVAEALGENEAWVRKACQRVREMLRARVLRGDSR